MLSFLLAAESAAEGVETASNPILPTGPEMFWGAVAFFSLYALVKFVLLPPVLATMAQREATIRGDLDAAARAEEGAGTAATAVADQLVDVRNEAAAVVDAARAEAEAGRADVINAANAEVAALKAEADAEIASARAEALAGVRPQVAELATAAASKVTNRQIDLAKAQPVVDRFLENSN